MKCQKCDTEFLEKDLQESHDVPCYLFYKEIGRPQKKARADKLGRHWLCLKCHDNYESQLSISLKLRAINFANMFFKKENDSISKI